jgi:nucleotide-binding universal stress UspA family protein
MRHILIAADESDCARSAATWACSTLVHKDDQVSLIAVLPALDPVAVGLAVPDAFTSVAAAAASLEDQLEVQRRRLTKLMEDLIGHLDPLCEAQLQAHVLPAGGGASGVAESICAYAKKVKADLVVVGSRGMGAVKSTVMSVVGLGSVSDYLLHHLSITTCVVHGTGLQVGPKEMRKVLVAVEDSEHSKKAERWAIENVLGPNDQLHLVAVALPVPYVVSFVIL